MAVEAGDAKDANIWIHDLTGATSPRQLTFGGRNHFPVWSHDGERVLFQSDREGDLAIFWQRADGSNTAERLTKPDKGVAHVPESRSQDGKTVLLDAVLIQGTELPKHSLSILSMPDRKVEPFRDVQSSTLPTAAALSPDGHWVAYTLGDGATRSIYVQPFPATGAKYLIASRAFFPMWSPDGKELFFVQRGGLQVVTVTPQPSFTLGNPTVLSLGGMVRMGPTVEREFDIMPDGQRFIGVVPAGQTPGAPAAAQIQVVLNWFEELKRLVPAN